MAETQWHLDRRVTLGTIVSLVAVAVGLIGAWVTFDRRVTRLEVTLDNSNVLLHEVRVEIKGLRDQMRSDNEAMRREIVQALREK